MSGREEPGKPAREGVKSPGKEALRAPLPKRFYRHATVAEAQAGTGRDAFRVLLDDRPLKTPGKRDLAVPTKALADAIAAEWAAQETHINPANMPLTRLANTAIDAVADSMPAVAADIVAYAASDLLCYRAESPAELVHRQAVAWDPVLAWAREALGTRFVLTEGVIPVAQEVAALEQVAAALAAYDPFALSALHVMTTLTGSALLALANARGACSAAEAWAAAHVDEDYQIELWGSDVEAEARRAMRRREFEASSRLLGLLR